MNIRLPAVPAAFHGLCKPPDISWTVTATRLMAGFRVGLASITISILISTADAGDVEVPPDHQREVAARIQTEVARALDGQIFTGSAEKRFSQDLLLIQPSATITATATGTFTRPDQNLQVDVSSLTFTGNDSVRISLCVRGPFAGKVSAKSRIGSAGTDYTAALTVQMNVETAIRWERDGTIALTPHLKSVRPVVSEVRLNGQISDRLFAGTVTEAINHWMQDNPRPFHDAVLLGAEVATRMLNDERQQRMDKLLAELARHEVSPRQIEVIRQLLNSLSPHQQSLLFAAIHQGTVATEITPQQRALIESLTSEQRRLLLEIGQSAAAKMSAVEPPASMMSATPGHVAGRSMDSQAVSKMTARNPDAIAAGTSKIAQFRDASGLPRGRQSSATGVKNNVAETSTPSDTRPAPSRTPIPDKSSRPAPASASPVGTPPMDFTPEQRRAAETLLRALRKL